MKDDLIAITLKTTSVLDFSFHFDGGGVVIDTCTGIAPEAGMAMFPDWIIQAMKVSN